MCFVWEEHCERLNEAEPELLPPGLGAFSAYLKWCAHILDKNPSAHKSKGWNSQPVVEPRSAWL